MNLKVRRASQVRLLIPSTLNILSWEKPSQGLNSHRVKLESCRERACMQRSFSVRSTFLGLQQIHAGLITPCERLGNAVHTMTLLHSLASVPEGVAKHPVQEGPGGGDSNPVV